MTYDQFRRAYIALHLAIEIGNPDADTVVEAALDYVRGTGGLPDHMRQLQHMTMSEVFELANKLRKQKDDDDV